MSTLRPFRAFRPSPDRAALVAAVPYDVVNTQEARQLSEGNPWSFLHVSRPEIDLPFHTDPHSPEVYKKARENFNKLGQSCPFISENSPMLYLYRLRIGDHRANRSRGWLFKSTVRFKSD